jgi:integrase
MPLSETAIRQTKPAEKPIKLFDGREKLLALGVHPDVSLKIARDRREAARQQVASGIDPGAKRQAEKAAAGDTFEAIAREWLVLQERQLAPSTYAKAVWILERFAFPRLGQRPVNKITARDLLAALRKIEVRGTFETTHRAKQRCSQIFRFAIASGRAQHDISADLRGALAPVKTKNHAAIVDPIEVGALLRAIDGYRGNSSTTYALKLAPLTFVRPGELRRAVWSEFDLVNAEWRIAAERMKMRDPHIVPLSWQALELFTELRSISHRSHFVFPSHGSIKRPISENTVNSALRRLGYSHDEMTGHGFRSTASTLLNEQGWHPDLIELQLAHAERNKVRAAYNRAQRLTERRTMMQAWADYLDQLKSSRAVMAFPENRGLSAEISSNAGDVLARVSAAHRDDQARPGASYTRDQRAQCRAGTNADPCS